MADLEDSDPPINEDCGSNATTASKDSSDSTKINTNKINKPKVEPKEEGESTTSEKAPTSSVKSSGIGAKSSHHLRSMFEVESVKDTKLLLRKLPSKTQSMKSRATKHGGRFSVRTSTTMRSAVSSTGIYSLKDSQVEDFFRVQREANAAKAEMEREDFEATLNDEFQMITHQSRLEKESLLQREKQLEKQLEEQRKQEEEQRKLEKEQRKLEEEQRKLEEEQRKLEEEHRRQVQAKNFEEQKRQLEEEREKILLREGREKEMIEERRKKGLEEMRRREKRGHLELNTELKLEMSRRGATVQSTPQEQPNPKTALLQSNNGSEQQSTNQPVRQNQFTANQFSESELPGASISAYPRNMYHVSNITSEPKPLCVTVDDAYVAGVRVNGHNPIEPWTVTNARMNGLGDPCVTTTSQVTSAPLLPTYSSDYYNRQSTHTLTHAADSREPMVPNTLSNGHVNAAECNQTYQPRSIINPMQYPVIEQLTPLKLEPKIFSGDPVEFDGFKEILHAALDRRTLSQKQKYFYLRQHTKGVARALVVACEDKPNCFDEAFRALEGIYGQPFQISESCISSILNGPKLLDTDRESILMFYASMTACTNKLKKLNRITDVNRTMIKQIANRMPESWKAGWRTVAAEVTFDMKSELTLVHLSEYVRQKAREIICEAADFQPSSKPASVVNPIKSMKPKAATFSTQASTNGNQSCSLCRENHFLNQCKQFRKMEHAERLNFVKENKLCFRCLSPSHFSKDCQRTKPCIKPDCLGKHTTLLRPPEQQNQENESTNTKEDTADSQAKKTYARQSTSNNNNVTAYFSASNENDVPMALNIISVKLRVCGKNHTVSTLALIDNASNCSFISQSLIDKMNLTGPELDVTIQIIDSQKNNRKSVVIENLELSDCNESKFIPLKSVISTEQIIVDKSLRPTQNDINQFPEFQGIAIPRLDGEIGLLIGINNPSIHKPLQVIHGPDDYFAVKSIAGWMVTLPKQYANTELHSYFIQGNAKKMCQMCYDDMDSVINEKKEYSVNEELFLDKVTKSIHLDSTGHYKMKLPLKHDNLKLPCNIGLAKRRISYLQKKFARDESFSNEYKAFLSDMLSKGYAEPIERDGPLGRTWYLSHHGVYHPEKKSLRVVFDASAKYENIALNDLLIQGPDLCNNLVAVLSRFRRNEIAIQGDIRAMFHQVKVEESDRDLFRFLWWKNGDPNQDLLTYRMTVFLFGTISSPSCCNYALKRTAQDNKEEYDNDVIESVFKDFYVDDYLGSKPDVASAISHIKDITSLLAKGGFEIAKWVSNNREVISAIPEESCAKNLKIIDVSVDELPMERTLGLTWHVEKDVWCFKVKRKNKPYTGGGSLSIVNSIFDPPKMAQTMLHPIKVLIQYLHQSDYEWDDSIIQIAKILWNSWLSHLPNLEKFSIPRCYIPSEFGKIVFNFVKNGMSSIEISP